MSFRLLYSLSQVIFKTTFREINHLSQGHKTGKEEFKPRSLNPNPGIWIQGQSSLHYFREFCLPKAKGMEKWKLENQVWVGERKEVGIRLVWFWSLEYTDFATQGMGLRLGWKTGNRLEEWDWENSHSTTVHPQRSMGWGCPWARLVAFQAKQCRVAAAWKGDLQLPLCWGLVCAVGRHGGKRICLAAGKAGQIPPQGVSSPTSPTPRLIKGP